MTPRALTTLLMLIPPLSIGGCASTQEAMTVRCVNGNMIEINGIQSNSGMSEAERWNFTEQCALQQSTGKEDK